MLVKKVEKTFYSYKDKASRVLKSNGKFVRYVHESYRREYSHLMESGLYDELVLRQLIVRHETLMESKLPQGYFLQLFPEQIPFLVEPFEWTYSEWQQAAISCLEINQIALSFGMILKDATPYNFVKLRGKMVMFDTTSFKFFSENDPWFAYRQFCLEFLGPIALIKYNGSPWSRLSRAYVKGLPLEFISNSLPLASYFNLQCLIHLHLHSRFEPRGLATDKTPKVKGFTIQGLELLLGSLKKSIASWSPKSISKSLWDHYYENDLEEASYLTNKTNQIRSWLTLTKPKKVVDLGANTGHFSLLASDYCEQVLAIENNFECIELFNQIILEKGIVNISTAVADLTQLSPDLGNGFKEIRNLGFRGRSDMAFSLALVHHLCLTFLYSFEQVIALCKQFTSKYLVIEFIPKTDMQAQTLLKTVRIEFHDYTLDNFEVALLQSFSIIEKVPIPFTHRILYLAEIKHDRAD